MSYRHSPSETASGDSLYDDSDQEMYSPISHQIFTHPTLDTAIDHRRGRDQGRADTAYTDRVWEFCPPPANTHTRANNSARQQSPSSESWNLTNVVSSPQADLLVIPPPPVILHTVPGTVGPTDGSSVVPMHVARYQCPWDCNAAGPPKIHRLLRPDSSCVLDLSAFGYWSENRDGEEILSETLAKPAMSQSTKMIEIKANLAPGVVHRIEIRAKNTHCPSDSEPVFVTVGDVLRGIYEEMQTGIGSVQQSSLWWNEDSAWKAFNKRCKLAAKYGRGNDIWYQGMKVVDVLDGKVMFAGLTWSWIYKGLELQVKKRENKGSGFFKFFKGRGKSKRRA